MLMFETKGPNIQLKSVQVKILNSTDISVSTEKINKNGVRAQSYNATCN